MKTGIELITEERTRQVSVEGWTAKHDDHHVHGELAVAAACYAETAALQGEFGELPPCFWPKQWPFERSAFKGKDRIRNLVKAGALIAAEIDRIQRARQ